MSNKERMRCSFFQTLISFRYSGSHLLLDYNIAETYKEDLEKCVFCHQIWKRALLTHAWLTLLIQPAIQLKRWQLAAHVISVNDDRVRRTILSYKTSDSMLPPNVSVEAIVLD